MSSTKLPLRTYTVRRVRTHESRARRPNALPMEQKARKRELLGNVRNLGTSREIVYTLANSKVVWWSVELNDEHGYRKPLHVLLKRAYIWGLTNKSEMCI